MKNNIQNETIDSFLKIRSSRVSNYLLSNDFKVSNLDGGMKALLSVTDNIVNSKGSSGQII